MPKSKRPVPKVSWTIDVAKIIVAVTGLIHALHFIGLL